MKQPISSSNKKSNSKIINTSDQLSADQRANSQIEYRESS